MHRLAAAIMAMAFLSTDATAGDYAPLNCARANAPAEQAICSNYGLGQSEARMATLFGITTSLVAMGQRGNIVDDQLKWLLSRNACGKSVACLTKAYDRRIRELETVMAAISSHGPY